MRREPGSGPRGSGTRAGLSSAGPEESAQNPVPDAAFPGFEVGVEDLRRPPDVTGRDVPQPEAVSIGCKPGGGASAVTPQRRAAATTSRSGAGQVPGPASRSRPFPYTSLFYRK